MNQDDRQSQINHLLSMKLGFESHLQWELDVNKIIRTTALEMIAAGRPVSIEVLKRSDRKIEEIRGWIRGVDRRLAEIAIDRIQVEIRIRDNYYGS